MTVAIRSTAGWRRWAFAASALLAVHLVAHASKATLSRPGNGITRLDLLGDGTPAMMVVGRRENYNAHSFDVASVYVHVDGQWEIVPIFDAAKEQDQLTAAGGADCMLHDFRLVGGGPRAPLGLVLADRDYGDSFVAVRPVTFRVYALTRNADSEAGEPTWRFQLRATRKSARPWCDVGDAFDAEFGARE